jgi:hypothetical protein
MQRLTRHDLVGLAATTATPCVTIQVPLHPGAAEAPRDRLALRESVENVRRGLRDWGYTDEVAERWLAPLQKEAGRIAERPADGALGAVLLATAEDVRSFLLPDAVPSGVDVAYHFRLSPLVPLAQDGGAFLLLALSIGRVRLYAVDEEGSRPRELPGRVAQGFEAFMAGTEILRAAQSRSTVGGTAVIHGQTSHRDDHKQRVREYVASTAREMQRAYGHDRLPELLAADDSLRGVFCEAYRGRNLLADVLAGSPDAMPEADLLTEARRKHAAWRDRHAATFEGRFVERETHGRATRILETVVSAADEGRIESLVVARDERAWGTFDPQQKAAVVHAGREPEDVDLLEFALRRTLLQGGEVHTAPRSALPGQSAAAAILRW